jgi:predicted metal-binding membrane protein
MRAETAVALQQRITLALLLGLAAVAWALLVWQKADAGMDMASPTMGMDAVLFLAVWVVMMVAMMFPTAAPMILTFHKLQANRRDRGEAFVGTWVFAFAYLLVWSASGVVAYAGAVAAAAAGARLAVGAEAAARIGGAVLVLAGLYQLTPLKDRCLAKCRTPVGFIMTSWRDGTAGALRMGLEHGAWCLGCCWLLFAILFPLGIMNVAAMALITAVILAEKVVPWERPVVRLAAVALIAYGAAVLAMPRLLPTFMAAGVMSMDMQAMPMNAMPAKP